MTFKQAIIQLESIAAGDCCCDEDVEIDDVCRICKASRTLNRIAADACDDLAELI